MLVNLPRNQKGGWKPVDIQE